MPRRDLGDGADAEAAGDVKGIVERLEAELNPVPGASRRGDVDVPAERGAECVGDQLDGRGLVRVEGRTGAATATAFRGLTCGPGAGLELANRPAMVGRVAGEGASRGVVGCEEQCAAVTFGEIAAIDQLERLVG